MKGTTLKELTRRQIRYLCFRLQTEEEGGNKANSKEGGIMEFLEEVKNHMEEQEDFGGWLKFAKTWDVDEKSPLVAVKRTSSIQTEWNKILKEETKVLPAVEEKPSGGEQQEKTEKKFLTNKLSEAVQEKQKEPTLLRGPDGKFASKKSSFWDKLR